MIGELIQSRSTLLALISTCRSFCDLFTPFLRRKFTFELTAIPSSRWRRKPLPTGLHYTQELEVLLEEFRGKGDLFGEYSESWNSGYVSLVVRILKEMKNLQSFRWIDSTYDDNYRPSLMLRNQELLQALKQSATIKNISILFASQHLDDQMDALNCSISLEGFDNLTSLELYNFYGDPDSLAVEIANVLAECPGLKTLGLGFACDFDCNASPDVLIIGEDEYTLHFLEKVCVNYASPTRVSLALDTLRLGHGIFLSDSVMREFSKTHKYLFKLVKLETLKIFYLFNGLVKWDFDEHESMDVDWDQLEDCKSLQRLSVSRLEMDLVSWLTNGCGSVVEELIVTDHYGMYDDDLDYFEYLLPRLSMLFVREMTIARRSGDEAWSDTDSSVTDSSEAEITSETGTILEVESLLIPQIHLKPRTLSMAGTPSQAGLRSDSETPSEARNPYKELDRSIITVLDRLDENGAQLTKLGLCLDFETQWVQFSSHLPNLRRLTHLRLDGKSYRGGQYPTKASSLWPGVEGSRDIAYHYGILIHSKCPSLKYIKIQAYAWEVAYQNLKSTIALRPLDQDEIASIDLFALQSFCSESGLPATERPSTPISDEELNETEERFSEKINAAYKESGLHRELQDDLMED